VSVFDVLGRQMTTQSFNKVSTIDLTIPCATWANGFYTVKIAQNGKAKTVKFLKQ
jgi:hypothetical protein